MIVDDNEMFVEMAKFVLTAAAYQVDTAPDASQALLQVPVFLPDVILMEVQMPGVDGLQLTRRLKVDASTRHIVVLAFTAFAMRGDEARMRAAGCDGYIAKPFDVASLGATVRSYLHAPGNSAAPPRNRPIRAENRNGPGSARLSARMPMPYTN